MFQSPRFRILTICFAVAVLLAAGVTMAAMPDDGESAQSRTNQQATGTPDMDTTGTPDMDGTEPADDGDDDEDDADDPRESRYRRDDVTLTPDATEPAVTGTPDGPATGTATGTATDTTDGGAVEGEQVAVCLSAEEQAFLELINDYRVENGLEPLSNSAALNEAAYGHSLDMSERGYFSHESPEGTTPVERMNAAGYTFNTTTAENIAQGQATAQEVFEAWQNSDEHNQIMLNPDLAAIGIGFVSDGNYWTTDFGGVVDAGPEC